MPEGPPPPSRGGRSIASARQPSVSPTSSSSRLLLKLEGAVALDPLARRVLDDLAVGHVGFGNVRDLSVVLAEVVARLDLIEQVVDLQERIRPAVANDASDHRHAVHRIGLERLLAPVDLGGQEGIRLPCLLLERDGELLRAEWLDRTQGGVRMRVELLRRRQRLDARLDLALLLFHPLLQLVLVAAAGGKKERRCDDRATDAAC